MIRLEWNEVSIQVIRYIGSFRISGTLSRSWSKDIRKSKCRVKMEWKLQIPMSLIPWIKLFFWYDNVAVLLDELLLLLFVVPSELLQLLLLLLKEAPTDDSASTISFWLTPHKLAASFSHFLWQLTSQSVLQWILVVYLNVRECKTEGDFGKMW